jgi:hypothetical protein
VSENVTTDETTESAPESFTTESSAESFTTATPREIVTAPGAAPGRRKQAIARALNEIDEEGNRPSLKKAGFLTRDPRVKERKKYGLKKARKAPQYSKR